MRSAELLRRARRAGVLAVLFALALGQGGCAMLHLGGKSDSVDAAPVEADTPPPKAAAPAAGPAAAGSAASSAKPPGLGGAAASGAAVAGVPVPAPVDPAVLQAFEAAVAALQAGHAEEARKGFAALASAHPELGGPHANLGILDRRAGKTDEAVAELEKAVHADEQQPVFWNQLGIAYRQQGHFDKARAAYERAISLDPSYPAPKLNLGVLFDLYLWDAPHALEQYQQYLALVPGGDEKVGKWVADLKNRSRAASADAAHAAPAAKEQP
jgi:Flp pilus assembly protein TadD